MAIYGSVALAAILVYVNSLATGFSGDDQAVIVQDTRIRDGLVWRIISENYWPANWADVDLVWRPLVSLSFAANWAVRPEALGFRVINLALHVLVSLWVVRLGRAWFGSLGIGWFAGLLFAVHAAHTEALNVVVGRADLAATLFVLLSLSAFSREGGEREASGRPAVWGTLCFAAALLCKESAVMLLPAVLAMDVWRARAVESSRRPPWFRQRCLTCYLPLTVVLVLYLGARYAALGALARDPQRISVADNVLAHPQTGLQAGDSATLARWGTPLALLGRALKLMVWPAPLCHDYSYAGFDMVRRGTDARLLLGIGWIAILATVAAVSWRRRGQLVWPIAFYLITYSLVSNTAVLIGTIFGERLLYLPSVGACLALACLGVGLLGRFGRPSARRGTLAAGTLLALLPAAHGYLTVARNAQWRSLETLAAADLGMHPRSVRLLSFMARVELGRGNLDQALTLCQRAIEILPDYPIPHRTAGLVHYQRGDDVQAILSFQKAFAEGGANDETAVCAAAEVLARRVEFAQAIQLLEGRVKQYPMWLRARTRLARYRLMAAAPELHDPARAMAEASQLLADLPHDGELIDTYTAAMAMIGRVSEALAFLEAEFAILPPNDPYRDALQRRLDELRGLTR